MKRKESDLYKPALQWLNIQPQTMAWPNYNSGVYIPKIGRFVRKKGHQDGVADITGIKNGKPFAMEVKVPGNQATAAQRDWLERVVHCGGVAFIVYSMDDIFKSWEEI